MNFKYETKKLAEGFGFVIGCDEVGRGCLAGPVVAAAVVLPLDGSLSQKIIGLTDIRDSKVMSPEQREYADDVISRHAVACGVGVIGEKIIDKVNIHNASLIAMKRAVEILHGQLLRKTDRILLAVDGKFIIPNFEIEQEAVVDGDAKILSIAAASVIAKVYRDNLMKRLHIKHPEYGFSAHKGYATFHHREAIKKYGLLPQHRLSFCGKYV